MNKNIIKVAGLALAAAFAISAKADVAIHQNVSVYGYAAGSVQYSKDNGASSNTDMDLDAAKLGLAFNFAPVTAKVSIFTDKGAKELYVLEANATYDIGNGFSVTGGRYQSWLGYEAFDIPNGNFITNGNEIDGIIPNFHEGVKIEYAFGKSIVGLSLVDSIYNSDADNKYRGDGKLSDGYGVEARYAYNDGALSLQGTLAYQNTRAGQFPIWNDTYIADLWAQYTVKATTFGAEAYYLRVEDSGAHANVYYGLVMVKQQMSEKFSLAGRLSAGKDEDANYWKVSAVPAYAVTKNLSVCAEVSYTKYNDDFQAAYGKAKSKLFAGVQACFKF